MENRATTVLLADDHTMFREGLAKLLTAYGGLEVVGETTNDDGAAALAREKKPDVVIMEARVPFEEARGFLDEMRRVEPRPKVIIVTMFDDPAMMRNFLRLGVSGYVLKSSSTTQLVSAIRAAAFAPERGNVVVGMPRTMLEETEGGPESPLSVRELEILLLASRGLSNRQIAARVHLTEGTVKRHLSNTYHKMGVGSRGEAARKALQEDWITVGEITDEEAVEEEA
ncbi:response regulator transcription factor [soil metagenome]|jgi:DNA-binding NarL/FixJ family response regulator|nr:response regulator transcription factor [Rubrobacter sp.]MDQ3360744.1 response regulator transcription factor [Actinomycetota bacterium]